MRPPIPAWVVTGPLGCGKTTLIAGLLAAKPAQERWAVLLNEFSDAGIDALTVAAAARGPYDVRLAQERFPKIHFHPLREHAGLALGSAG